MAGKAKGARYRLPATGATIGRTRAAILLPEDPHVSPHHATLLVRDGVLSIRDEASASGVYVSIAAPEALAPGTLFCAGEHLFRYAGPVAAPVPTPGRPVSYGAPLPSGQALFLVEEILAGGRAGRAVTTGGPLLTIGRANCDLSFPQDESMAARHCELSPQQGSAQLRDLSGGQGTFIRIPPQTERPLRVGDRIRLGLHVIQVEPPA
ncbi:MAG: FHA domain-containing protein [Myxococcaceae bacterium]|nr:FHA domain-containing protein [Myxococcaceae bacterium]MCI0673433.1 FHA domain-containing protein [Myxococcaceae bacterium]